MVQTVKLSMSFIFYIFLQNKEVDTDYGPTSLLHNQIMVKN